MGSYNMWSLQTSLFCLALCTSDASMALHDLINHSLSFDNSIPFNGFTWLSYYWRAFWFPKVFGHCQESTYTKLHVFLVRWEFLKQLPKYLSMQMLAYMARPCLALEKKKKKTAKTVVEEKNNF